MGNWSWGFIGFISLVFFWGSVLIWFGFSGLKRKKIKIFTVTGPSGAGKTTIVGELLKRHPEWKMVISLTSRNPRDSDLPGEYRCLVRMDEFLWRDRGGEFIWIVSPHGCHYGTLLADVRKALDSDKPSMMQITPEAVEKLRTYAPGEVLSIFMSPPGEEELRRRLENRGEQPEAIDRRIADCRKWEEEARESGLYKFVENNGTVEEVVEKVEQTISRYL